MGKNQNNDQTGLTSLELNQVVSKMGGDRAARKFLRNKLVPVRSWREKDGVISFLVTSDGTSGHDWISRLERKGFRINDDARFILQSKHFIPTIGVTTKVVILKGEIFKQDDLSTKCIRMKGEELELSVLSSEIACLVREKFSDEDILDMGIGWIIIIHEPIKIPYNGHVLMQINRSGVGNWLSTYDSSETGRWDLYRGFAFEGKIN